MDSPIAINMTHPIHDDVAGINSGAYSKETDMSKPLNDAKRNTVDLHGRVPKAWKPTQIALVFQGGGALGAYQAGVYQALHEAGIDPDWMMKK